MMDLKRGLIFTLIVVVSLIGFLEIYTSALRIPDTSYDLNYSSIQPEADIILYATNGSEENASITVRFENTDVRAYNTSNMKWRFWTESTGVFVTWENLPERWKNPGSCDNQGDNWENGVIYADEHKEYCLDVRFPYQTEFGLAVEMERYDSTMYVDCGAGEKLSCGGDVVYNRSELELDLESQVDRFF